MLVFRLLSPQLIRGPDKDPYADQYRGIGSCFSNKFPCYRLEQLIILAKPVQQVETIKIAAPAKGSIQDVMLQSALESSGVTIKYV